MIFDDVVMMLFASFAAFPHLHYTYIPSFINMSIIRISDFNFGVTN